MIWLGRSKAPTAYDLAWNRAASSPLADAWEQFWEAGDRAERARLLRGHPGGPARRGESRQPTGIIPLLGSGHVGSAAVTGLLKVVADVEEGLAVLAPQGGWPVSRARAAAVTAAAMLATRIPAGAVPVPAAAWTPAAGLLIVILVVATSAATIRHHRNRLNRPATEWRGGNLMNPNRVTVTVLSAAVAWATWRIHAGAGSLGPLVMPAESWAASIVIIVIGIVLSCALFTAIASAMGGGWRPRT